MSENGRSPVDQEDEEFDIGYHEDVVKRILEESGYSSRSINEAEAKRHGVTIKHYHADNGLFRTKPFEQDIEKKGQTLTFAGVGAHHQNGIAGGR